MSAPRQPIRVAITARNGRRTPSECESASTPTSSSASKPTEAQAAAPTFVQTPPIDIHEDEDGLILEADIPGAVEDAITIQVEDSVLSLRADVQPNLPENARPIRLEYPIASFQRTFILSDEVDRARITAELKGGVLRLTLPKAERAKPRKIEILNEED